MLYVGLGHVVTVHADKSARDIRILRSDENKLIFEYLPASPSFTTVSIDGQTYVSLQLNNCGHLYEEGKPILPVRTLLVGMPNHGRVTARMADFQWIELEGYQLLPAPKVNTDEQGNVMEKRYLKNPEIYLHDSFFPDISVEVSEPSWLRHQKVVDVHLFPVQYNPVSGRLRVCKKMRVEIDFGYAPSSRKEQLIAPEPVFEDLYANRILNYAIAKKWREAVPKRVAKQSSTLSGLWYKMTVENDGIYKLDYATFAEMGLDSMALSAEHIRILYGGGRELPQEVTEKEPALQEVATYFYDANQDGLLGNQDYLLFYGQGASGWAYNSESRSYSHYINHYTNQNVYWLSIGNGLRKKMQRKDGSKLYHSAPLMVDKYRHRIFREEEKLNMEKSGIEWMWDRLYRTMYREYPIQISHISENDSATLRVRVQGITEYHHDVSFFLNGQLLREIDLPYTLAKTVEMKSKEVLVNGDNVLRILLRSPSGVQSEIYFDWHELEYWRYLRAENDQLYFSSSGKPGVLEYRLEGFSANDIALFEVSNPFEVVKIENTFVDSTNVISFRDSVNSSPEHRYLALAESQYQQISDLLPTNDPHSNLRLTTNAADYVMIAHESLKGPALERLAAHRRDSRYWPHAGNPQVKIVTTEEIYNEFSWGLFDPTAIRNFLKYAYENWSVAPSYVLLVGDACYDMKNNTGGSPPTLVPTYEEAQRATDDWFVCLDGDRKMDMLIGRLAVQSVDELEVAVEKIIHYDTTLPFGPWKNTVLLVADDNYSPQFKYDDFVFGRDTEILATDSVSGHYDVKKIYLYQYPRDQFGKKPQAKEDYIQNFNEGAVYINFLGHGNHEQIAHENLFYSPDDISLLNNGGRLPLFFAGTCAVGQFDYDRKKSMAEELILRIGGGCFAVIGASRWNAHQITFGINQVFYQKILAGTSTKSLGQALLEAKLQSRYPDHRELLILFGDPAQRLAVPQYSVSFSISPDSIALTRNVQIKGEIRKEDKILSDFSGAVFVKFYDSFFTRYAIGYEYSVPGSVTFADTLRVKNGKIDSNFFLQADTTAGGSRGHIVAYAWEEKSRSNVGRRDAAGFLDSLYVFADTLAAGTRIDSLGPQISVEVNSVPILPNDEHEIAVPPSFMLHFRVNDNHSGINVSSKPGYEITIQVDDRPDKTWDVTSDFVFDQGSRKSGRVAFRFENLSLGTHQIIFSVWDNSLNRATIKFPVIVEPESFQIIDPLNYPNPAPGRTTFTFTLSHDAEVTIKIYTVAGRLIRVFQTNATRGFNRLPEESWDCTDEDGDPLANGVYLYKISAKQVLSPYQNTREAAKTEALGRMAIIR